MSYTQKLFVISVGGALNWKQGMEKQVSDFFFCRIFKVFVLFLNASYKNNREKNWKAGSFPFSVTGKGDD